MTEGLEAAEGSEGLDGGGFLDHVVPLAEQHGIVDETCRPGNESTPGLTDSDAVPIVIDDWE